MPVDHAPGDVAQWLRDLKACLIFLTRLPIAMPDATPPALAASARAFGPAGAIIGALVAVVFCILHVLSVPPGVAVAAMLGAQALLTGALHEDGLADCADGFGGGHDRESRLAIMRDSRIGSYGVIALVLAFLIRWSALAHIAAAASIWPLAGVMIATASLSRTAMVLTLRALPAARADGRSAEAGRPGRSTLAQAAGIALIIFVAVLWPVASLSGMAVIVLTGLAASLAVAALSRRLIGVRPAMSAAACRCSPKRRCWSPHRPLSLNSACMSTRPFTLRLQTAARLHRPFASEAIGKAQCRASSALHLSLLTIAAVFILRPGNASGYSRLGHGRSWASGAALVPGAPVFGAWPAVAPPGRPRGWRRYGARSLAAVVTSASI